MRFLAVRGVGVLGAAFFFFGLGCSDEALRPHPSELQEGLTVLKAEPTWGVNLAYVKNKRAVFVETRIGQPRPEAYRLAWPDDPANEIDMRVLDTRGRVFILQRGGDVFADPSWEADVAQALKPHPDITPEERAADIELAWEALGIAAVSLPESFKEHLHYIRTVGSRVPFHRNPEMAARLRELASRPEAKEKPSVRPQLYGTYEGGIYWGALKYAGSSYGAADHSAVDYVFSFDGWQTAYLWVFACNHGRCSYDSGMYYSCASGGGWFYAISADVETNRLDTSVSGACRSPYNWYTYSKYWWGSTGTKNTHLCNDDAAYELWQAKYGTAWTPAGDMYSFAWKDPNGNRYACYCNSDHHCAGDWASPACL